MIKTITRAYLCHYTDTGQRTLYIEFLDERGRPCRLECEALAVRRSRHMSAVLERAVASGIKLEREEW